MKFLVQNKQGKYWLSPGNGTTDDRSEAFVYSDVPGGGGSFIPQDFISGDLAKIILEEVPTEAVTVGDLNSSSRGTGARKSADKPDWSQLPLWVVEIIRVAWLGLTNVERRDGLYTVLTDLARWQRGDNQALDRAAALLLHITAKEDVGVTGFPVRSFLPTVAVLEFGAKKYAKGNWAKGMPWSVCYTCAISHITKQLAGEEEDEESGLTHLAHAMCNLVFLIGYRDLYPEGDDRLPEFRPGGVKVDLRND